MSRLTVATAQTSPARKSLRFICSYLVGGADPSAASGERRSPSLDELKRSLARLVKVIVVDFGRPSHLRAHGLWTAAHKPGSLDLGGRERRRPVQLAAVHSGSCDEPASADSAGELQTCPPHARDEPVIKAMPPVASVCPPHAPTNGLLSSGITSVYPPHQGSPLCQARPWRNPAWFTAGGVSFVRTYARR